MSKIKSPAEKKRLSLKRDRRNAFGESAHGARKAIPRRKAAQHQQERHSANQALGKALRSSSVESLESVESEVRSGSRLKRLAGFKKIPDEPLERAIKRKRAKRAKRTGRRRAVKNI
jgi:hypothetical protein